MSKARTKIIDHKRYTFYKYVLDQRDAKRQATRLRQIWSKHNVLVQVVPEGRGYSIFIKGMEHLMR